MAIYTGGMRIEQAKRKAAKDIAKQQRAALKKEGKRKFWSNITGKGLGATLGAGVAGALGIASGGLLMPLVMGASSAMAKKWTDEASQKITKAGKIEATSPYGFGKEAAKEAREDIKESRKSAFKEDPLGTIAKDVALSYVSAGAQGELGGAKQLLKGKLTPAQALRGTTTDKFGNVITGTGETGIKGGISGVSDLFGVAWGEGGDEAKMMPTSGGEAVDPSTIDLTESLEGSGLSREQYDELVASRQKFDADIGQSYETNIPSGMRMIEEGEGLFAQGGQVPTQQQLLSFLALSQMQRQETTYDNTPLEEKNISIADMFASKGKTLGGNSTQSLSQMLGR